MLETDRWEVQVKPFTYLTAHGRVPRRRSNCLCFFATIFVVLL